MVQARTWVTLLTGHMGDTHPADMGDTSGFFLGSGYGTGVAWGARSVAEHGAPRGGPAAFALWGAAPATTSLAPSIRRVGGLGRGQDARHR
jgi:hypothetical protein